MWAYNKAVLNTISSFESTLGIHHASHTVSGHGRRSSMTSYLRSEVFHALHPNVDNHIETASDWTEQRAPSMLSGLTGGLDDHAPVLLQQSTDESPTTQSEPSPQPGPETLSEGALPQAQNGTHKFSMQFGTSSHGSGFQLPNYWVSGIDGSYPDLPPEQLTEYYSIGKTEPFIGDIMVPGNAAEAFRKCSYKKEAIVMCTDVGDIWFEFAFGQVLMMRARGYAHVIIYMDNHKHCEQFQSYMPDVCCVYSSIFEGDKQLSDFWTPLGRLWTIRWLLVGKGLQLGYNVLHIDNDVMFTTDIYRYLKHPIFQEYNIIALGTPALIGINCGIVYGQNAHPAGPSAWAAYQVPDRTMRWLDDQSYILDKLNATGKQHKLQDIGFEQSVYNDALWSIVSGKPFFSHSLRPDYDPGQMGKWEKFHKGIGPDRINHIQVEGPADWAPILQTRFHNTNASFLLRYYDTKVVSKGDEHDVRLGPWPFPEQRGPLSQKVQRFINEGAEEVFHDWENAISDELVASTREKFLIAPGWLMGAWNKDGWHGYWHIDHPHAVLAHMVGIGGKHQQGKKLGFKVGGWWHYNATAMLQGERLFWSSTKAHPLPRMLVLRPGYLLQANKLSELMGMHIGLILAGYLSDRVWHWPLLDCHGRWARVSSDDKHWTGSFDPRVLPYGGIDNLKCIDLDLTWNYCMEKGMSGPDFDHYSRVRPDLVEVTAENTIHIPDDLVPNPWDNGAPSVKSITDVELKRLLATVEDQHVVYVSDLFLVRQEGLNEPVHQGTCVPRCDYEAMQPGLTKNLKRFESVQGCHPFQSQILPSDH